MLIDYVSISTNDQNTDLQRNTLNCAECELIFEDKITGTKPDRLGLKKLFRTLSAGDTLVVWTLDKLGRSMRHLVVLVEELRERGINFRSLSDFIDTSRGGWVYCCPYTMNAILIGLDFYNVTILA
ncbi:TPA: recombinase family protein [Salmonella enterica subsp. arizonae serovar 13,22:z4,z23:-]|nr:recombinase family protein [Salmonella enterica]EBR1502187.1 recombinase family protein [Salmonella enterica]EDW5131319.1 recombinase family protein [Salmonella enterica]EHD1621322.1 recombinase family protein [Salmonella enterica]HBJ6281311.1 recombinase family protein [Salmonella enterica subsp. arizonae serovar 13,22:z4,z23:-]